MKATFFILFYLRKNRPDKNGLVPIMEKITINGERVQFGINLKIHPNQWDAKNGRAIGRSTEAININRVLGGLKVRTEDIFSSQLKEKGYTRPEIIRDILGNYIALYTKRNNKKSSGCFL